jgi:beta-glucosidase
VAVGLGADVESEGRDREAQGLALPGLQNQLVADAIGTAKKKDITVVVLLFVAGPVDPALFDDADAILYCVYPAEATGLAITDLLFGKVSPAGRLPFSWPTTAKDVPPEANYTMAGRTYRYGQKNVKWSFGFGRSFSSFAYGSSTLSKTSFRAERCTSVNVSVTIHNTGTVAADEVAQGYLVWKELTPAEETPSLSLFDFERVHIQAGASTALNLSVSWRAKVSYCTRSTACVG